MRHLLILLILVNCPTIHGVLEWTVIGKVTDYGQNVTLFCNVSNCCPQEAGWDRWTPVQRTLFIDVKTGTPNKKYDGKVMRKGYTLIIQNLTKEDLNVSYSCLYGVTLGQQKLLLEDDVFTEIKHSNESTEERPVFEMSLPVNRHTASSTCSKDSTMKNDVITTVASTEVNTSIAKSSDKWTESKTQEETHVTEDDALPLVNMTRYEKRKVVEDYQIKSLKQEHIKLKNENIKLLREIDVINEKKVITVLKKLIKLQLKKMKLDMKVENEC